jgi:hypothetical protein
MEKVNVNQYPVVGTLATTLDARANCRQFDLILRSFRALRVYGERWKRQPE